MKKPYISVNFWLCWHCLTMSVRYQLMANNANRLNRGGIIIDNEENEAGIGFSPCQNSKNCCIFIFLVTVGFIMYLPFIPFSSNKRKFSILTLARFASWRQIFIHESWNTCREWFRDDLELWLSLIQTFYLKNFYKKVKIFRQIAIFTRFTTKRQIKKFDFPSNRKVLTWI